MPPTGANIHPHYEACMIRYLLAIAMVSGALTQHPETKTIDTRQAEIIIPHTRCTYSATIYDYALTSYYADYFHGRQTANGETFDMHGISVAHKTLPFGTVVKFYNPKNGRTVVARINDRGPYIEGREFDLSYGAAAELGMIEDGVVELGFAVM